MKTRVTLVYPFDPLGTKVGGIETFQRGFIKYSPADMEVSHVGIGSKESERPVRTWHEINVGGKDLKSFSTFREKDENVKTRVPLGLRFSLALAPRRNAVARGVLIFNRLEPAYLFRSMPNPKIGFVHNDIQEQLSANSEYSWRHSRRLYFAMERRVFATLNHLYVVNSNAVEFYRDRYPKMGDRISFLPTWVDEGVFGPPESAQEILKANIQKKFGIPSEDRWILFVGRFQKQKDPLLLVRAFGSLVSQGNARARLVLVGEGNMKSKMVAVAEELGIIGQLHFLGFLPQPELCKLYQASDALLLTSEFEGMPRAALEALGCGLPVVSTPSGDIQRVLTSGKTGELVFSRSAEEIGAALEKVLSRPRTSWRSACLDAVAPYRPRAVLKDVYELCAALSEKT